VIPAVVLGLSPTGLYAIRELGQAGVPVLGVAGSRQTASRSRYLTYGPGCLIEPDEDRRLSRLMDLFPADGPKAVLIPTSDQDIDFVIRHAQVLSERFVMQPSYRDGVHARVFGKAGFYAACREHGLEAPSYWEARRGELAALRGQITYPCLVKPSEIHEVKDYMAGRKVLIAPDAAAFDAIVAALPATDVIWLVQEIVPGPESNITLYCAYFDGESAPHQAFTARKLRQFPPGFGSASLVRSEVLDETRELSERLLRGIGFKGIAAAEFKRDPRDGRLKAIEVNVRPSLWFGVATAAGKPLTLAAYLDLSGQPMPPERPQANGVEWRYLLKDLYARAFYWRSRGFILPPPELGGLGAPARRTTPVLDFTDLRPSVDEMWNYGDKLRRRISAR
jgi:D-aspartate ligase